MKKIDRIPVRNFWGQYVEEIKNGSKVRKFLVTVLEVQRGRRTRLVASGYQWLRMG